MACALAGGLASGCDHDRRGDHPIGTLPPHAVAAPPRFPDQEPLLPVRRPQTVPEVAVTRVTPVAQQQPNTTVTNSQPTIGPNEDGGNALAVDAQGNSFVAGRTMGALDGATSLGSADGFVTKWAPDGKWLWTQQYGTSGQDIVHAIALATDGDIIIAGRTEGQLGSAPLGSTDAFVARLDPQGGQRWAVQFGSAGLDFATALATSADGAIYVASIQQQDPTGDGATAVLSALDGDGSVRWEDRWGGIPSAGAEPFALAARNGVLYVAGRSSVHFDARFWGDGAGGRSIGGGFLRRYDPSGQLVWEQIFAASDTSAYGVAVDADDGAIVTGTTLGALAATANLGASDGFLMRFDPRGVRSWSRQFGTLGWDDGRAVALAQNGDIVVTGGAIGDFDADPATDDGAFIMRCDPQGVPRWIHQGFADVAFALASAPDDSAQVTGWLFDPAASDPALEVDAYLARFDARGSRTLLAIFGSDAR